jgi:uncharacterized protein
MPESKEVESPCIFVCAMVDGLCSGCYRTSEEIKKWCLYSEAEKQEVVDALEKRRIKNHLTSESE